MQAPLGFWSDNYANGKRVNARAHFGRNMMERINNWHKDHADGQFYLIKHGLY